MPVTLTAAGLAIQDLAEIRAELADDVRTATGIQTLLTDSDDSGIGQFVGTQSERESLIQELLQDMHLQWYVVDAEGTQLDKAVAQGGVVRKPATESLVDIQVTNPNPPAGPGLTVPAGALLELSTGERFASVAAQLVADGATETVQFRALVAGPTAVPIGATWTWVSAFLGSTELTMANAAVGTAGQAREIDSALRVRFFNSRHLPGAGTLGSIRAVVLALEDVELAHAFENVMLALGITTPELIAALPGKSFAVVAKGTYTAAAIGAAILSRKPAGIRAWGSSSVNVADEDNFVHAIGYTAATAEVVTIALAITGSSATYSDDVKDALEAYGAALTIGRDVSHLAVLASVLGAAPGATGVTGTVNGVALSTTGALSIAWNKYADIQAAAITLVFA